jgi:hypothetical protein
MRHAAVIVTAATLAACQPPPTLPPTLGAVMSRVDVPRLLDCARSLPDYSSAAACLGARLLTVGLKAAIDRATGLAQKAEQATAPAGADDMTDTEKRELATDLDAAMGQLAIELDAAGEVP